MHSSGPARLLERVRWYFTLNNNGEILHPFSVTSFWIKRNTMLQKKNRFISITSSYRFLLIVEISVFFSKRWPTQTQSALAYLCRNTHFHLSLQPNFAFFFFFLIIPKMLTSYSSTSITNFLFFISSREVPFCLILSPQKQFHMLIYLFHKQNFPPDEHRDTELDTRCLRVNDSY